MSALYMKPSTFIMAIFSNHGKMLGANSSQAFQLVESKQISPEVKEATALLL